VRALSPIFFQKAEELRDRWDQLVSQGHDGSDVDLSCEKPSALPHVACNAILNVSHWLSRATFDVIGLAGFDYHFHALHDESEDVYLAYHRMFKAIDKGPGLRGYLQLHFPLLERFWVRFVKFWVFVTVVYFFFLLQPDECARITKNSLHIIHSTGKKLVEDKKASVFAEKYRIGDIQDKDLLSLLSRFPRTFFP
jgi:hypothetical protein